MLVAIFHFCIWVVVVTIGTLLYWAMVREFAGQKSQKLLFEI